MTRKKTGSSNNEDNSSKKDMPLNVYEIGYRKPPKQHQFQKGQSGNPRGRPKRTKSEAPSHPLEPLKDVFLKEAYRKIKTEDGKTITMMEAMVRSLMVNAAKGHLPSLKLVTQIIADIEMQDRQEKEEFFKTAYEYKSKWTYEFQDRRSAGLPEPNIVPHPDHIILDPSTLNVTINGPATDEQKEYWDKMVERRDLAIKNIREAQEALEKTTDPKEIEIHEDTIRQESATLCILLKYLKPQKGSGLDDGLWIQEGPS